MVKVRGRNLNGKTDQTDGGKTGTFESCDVMVPHWCHPAIMARSRDWIKIFVISRNQPASSDDMLMSTCAPTASVFASNRTLASEKRFGHRKTCAASQWNLRQHHSFALLERFEGSWRSRVLLLPGASFSTVIVEKGSVQIMATLRRFLLATSTNIDLIFGGSTLRTFLLYSWWQCRWHLSMHCPYPHTVQFIRHSPPTPRTSLFLASHLNLAASAYNSSVTSIWAEFLIIFPPSFYITNLF